MVYLGVARGAWEGPGYKRVLGELISARNTPD